MSKPDDHARLELIGSVASFGYAMGRLWFPAPRQLQVYQPKADAKLEEVALKQAIAVARNEIHQLMAVSQGSAKDILELQFAIFCDCTFFEEALKFIGHGKTAHWAWNAVLQTEIAAYDSATDPVFRARAADLLDIQTRVLRILCKHSAQSIPGGVIVVSDNLTPTAFITHDWQSGGLALTNGSSSSHLAILARQFGVPMLVGFDVAFSKMKPGQRALLACGAKTGKLIISPTPNDEIEARKSTLNPQAASKTFTPNVKSNGTPVTVMINLAQVKELDHLNVNTVDGIGLVRTEFVFAGDVYEDAAANEEAQFKAYFRILDWANGKPVFIRTIDAGGDKSDGHPANSAHYSKLRGIGLSLSQSELFRVQIRALLRAAIYGQLHVTLPMVSSENELNQSLELFRDEAVNLSNAGVAWAMPPIGIMVELPNVAKTLERFAKAAHFSIGTNDLIQYTLAEPRDKAGKKSGIEVPQMLTLIESIVSFGRTSGKLVCVCGDAASDASAVVLLNSMGINCFSVSPPSLHAVKEAIGNLIKDGKA